MQNIFIGVDGGGTKTKIRVENENGDLLAEARSGPANIGYSVVQAWQSILAGVNSALTTANLALTDKNYKYHLGLGLAGCEVQEAVNEFLATAHPFATVVLKSDSYAACLGAHGGKAGAIIVIGTGVVGLRVQKPDIVQVSGWGFPYDDEGGGAWLGLEVMRLVFKWQDGRIEASPLLHAIKAKFFNNFENIISWANNARATEFATLAPIVIEYVDKKDALALQLIKKAANKIDNIYLALEKRAQNKEIILPYSLFGGVAPFVEPWLGSELKQRLVSRKADATVGAIFIIKQEVLT